MRILCAGISHKTAGVEQREALAMDAAGAAAALEQLAELWPDAEAVVLSTCNRTEVYVARALHGHPRTHELHLWLTGRGDRDDRASDAIYTLEDAPAVRHLFEVAAGMDSQVVGESQIAGQVRSAYVAAQQASSAREVMNNLFQAAIHAGRCVRAETDLAAGGASIAALAAERVIDWLPEPGRACVLIVGAGKISELAMGRLAQATMGRVILANRSPQRREQLAERFGAQAVGLDDLPEHIAAADAVLTATDSPEAIITAEMVAEAQRLRGGRPLLIVDIAVPRDVAAAVGQIAGVTLLDIDQLGSVGDDGAADSAAAIIDRHVSQALASLEIRQVAPTIDAMYRQVRRIAAEELDRAGSKLTGRTDQDKKVLAQAMHRAIGRTMHPLVRNLRKASTEGKATLYLATIRKLFNLDQ